METLLYSFEVLATGVPYRPVANISPKRRDKHHSDQCSNIMATMHVRWTKRILPWRLNAQNPIRPGGSSKAEQPLENPMRGEGYTFGSSVPSVSFFNSNRIRHSVPVTNNIWKCVTLAPDLVPFNFAQGREWSLHPIWSPCIFYAVHIVEYGVIWPTMGGDRLSEVLNFRVLPIKSITILKVLMACSVAHSLKKSFARTREGYSSFFLFYFILYFSKSNFNYGSLKHGLSLWRMNCVF